MALRLLGAAFRSETTQGSLRRHPVLCVPDGMQNGASCTRIGLQPPSRVQIEVFCSRTGLRPPAGEQNEAFCSRNSGQESTP